MAEKTVRIANISCGHCVRTIQRELALLPGVEAVEGDPATKQVTVRWAAPLTWERIAEELAELGYAPDA